MTRALFESHLHSLPLIARGKVRDNYAVGNDRILMVASDRISAFDVVMSEPIPGKGETLTRMALFWFDKLKHVVPNHLTGAAAESVVAPDEVQQVHGRSMLVKRLKPLPIEAVVRGYLAGSGWKEYQQGGSVCGMLLPKGLRQAARLPEPIFTPATKAEAGTHDENISFAQAQALIGAHLAEQVRRIAIQLYQEAAAYALTRGIVIADTKFEFGLDDGGTLTLMDEVLTPDSSRFWPVDSYREGESPPSYDKQYLRDWLEAVRVEGAAWNKKAPAPLLTTEVVEVTRSRYLEALNKLTASPVRKNEDLLSRLQTLANGATNEIDRSIYRAQWAGAMARLGHIESARAEVRNLRAVNTAYRPDLTAWILIAEGLADHFESLSATALDRFKRAYGIAVAFGSADLWSLASAWMSASVYLTGDYESAVKYAVEAIQKAPGTGALALSRAHLVLANVLYAIGEHGRAASQYTKARQFAVQVLDISMQSAVLYNVAAFHIARVSLEDAFGASLANDVGLAELELNSITNLDGGIGVDSLSAMVPILRAQLLLVKRDWEQADRFYSMALPDAVTYGPTRWESRFLAEQSHCHAMLGKRASAAELASKAIAQLTERVEVDDLAACHARLALSLSALGDQVNAETHLKVANEFAAQFATRQSMQRERIRPLISPIQD